MGTSMQTHSYRSVSAALMRRYLADATRWRAIEPTMMPEELYLDIAPATALSVAAAEAFFEEISGAGGHWYLKQLSPQVAAVLVRNKPNELAISGLERVQPATAKVLARHTGWLGLGDLKHLSRPVALAFSRHTGTLNLGLEALDPAVARILARHRGEGLQLLELKELSAPVAAALARYPGELILHGVQSLSLGAATALAAYSGPRLGMYGLNNFPEEHLEPLLNTPGFFYRLPHP
jgi:hypothetical protein